MRYHPPVILSFRDPDAEILFRRRPSRRLPPDLQRAGYRKLVMLDAAQAVGDLRSPPGNRLEKLVGDRSERFSLRINRRWRICFRWDGGNAHDVEIVDYH